ncbi:hypothetical protein BKA70DRAFT_1360606 [Coprinopsis sp. MPI-PUGE-AT-0042]|nr:hypothetical protein BKA70DRAFT_1360606 [Coprinopsis sp. MPI-PUGE-AT-0042]
MTDQPQPPLGVVMFTKTNGQNFDNSNFFAAGRDHINLNINLATGGASHRISATSPTPESAETPSLPIAQPSPQHPPLLTRVYRRFRNGWARPAHNKALQEPDNVSPYPAEHSKLTQTPHRPVLSDGSNITSFDSCSQSPLVRQCVSGEEEVYERSLLPKGHGFPLFNPPPFHKPVMFGDFGILGQDGFESFGNIFDPNDQQEFSIGSPPHCDARLHPRKLMEGQVVACGIEDARRLTDEAQRYTRRSNFEPSPSLMLTNISLQCRTTHRFDFRCREPQGAALALTSSGDLESLTRKSRNQLREYLRNHGTQLMRNLGGKDYLEPSQSLYVVTGTIKSDSWAIAVHKSPMREPYDQMVLTRIEGNSGVDFPTHEWTCWGSADARCGASSSIDEGGGRVKDQCLFLRGFLLTMSPDVEQHSTTDDNGAYHADSGSGSGSSHSKDSRHTDRKGDHTRRTGQDARNPEHTASCSGSAPQYHLGGSLEAQALVQPFPEQTSECKRYYPSLCLNEMLLADSNATLAITHDDDWRHKIRAGYFDDEALSSFMTHLWETNVPMVSYGAATILPARSRTPEYWQDDGDIPGTMLVPNPCDDTTNAINTVAALRCTDASAFDENAPDFVGAVRGHRRDFV